MARRIVHSQLVWLLLFGAFLVAVFAARGFDDVEQPPAIQVAIDHGLGANVVYLDEDGRLHWFSTIPKEDLPIGSDVRYGAPRLSASGTHVAALFQRENEGQRLSIIQLDLGQETVVELPAGETYSFVERSPGTDVVAVVGTRQMLFDINGAEVASTGPSLPSPDGSRSMVSGGYFWSPNGAWFLALMNSHLQVLRVDGTVYDLSSSDISPGSTAPVALAGRSTTGPEVAAFYGTTGLLLLDTQTGVITPGRGDEFVKVETVPMVPRAPHSGDSFSRYTTNHKAMLGTGFDPPDENAAALLVATPDRRVEVRIIGPEIGWQQAQYPWDAYLFGADASPSTAR